MSPDEIRAMNIRALVDVTIDGLCCNAKHPTAADIMDHAVAHACLELDLVAKLLDDHAMDDGPLGLLGYVVDGVRRRLTLAREGASTLAAIRAESDLANG